MGKSTSAAHQKLEQIRTLIEEKGIHAFSLLEDLPIAVCITNHQGIFDTINENYCQVYGYQPEELLGKHFTLVVPEEKRKLLDSLHHDFIQNKYELQGEWIVQKKSGALTKILASAAYVEDQKGNPYKVTFLVELLDAEDFNDRLEKAIEYLSIEEHSYADRLMLFHDMKGHDSQEFTLGELLGMAEINPERYQRMEILFKQDRQALSVIDILSGLLKMEKKVFVLDKKRLDLINIIRKIILESSHVYQEKDIDFSIKISDKHAYDLDKVAFEGDVIYLELMFQNLFFFLLDVSASDSTVHVLIERNSHIMIRMANEVSSNERDYDPQAKGVLRLKHLTFLVVREHGGDASFSVTPDNRHVVTLTLPNNF